MPKLYSLKRIQTSDLDILAVYMRQDNIIQQESRDIPYLLYYTRPT